MAALSMKPKRKVKPILVGMRNNSGVNSIGSRVSLNTDHEW